MKNKIFRCEICGNVVELLFDGGGQLVCCGKPMIEQIEKKEDSGKEKHLPVIQKNRVIIGEMPHPMEKEHYIQWIEASNEKETSKVFLLPEQKPEAEFFFDVNNARVYCNIHGLWGI